MIGAMLAIRKALIGDRLSSRSYRKLEEQKDALAHLYPDDWPLTAKRVTAAPEV